MYIILQNILIQQAETQTHFSSKTYFLYFVNKYLYLMK